jgi:hypothetical protein
MIVTFEEFSPTHDFFDYTTSDEAALWEYGAADRSAVASGGIAEAVVSSCETRDGAPGTLCHVREPAKENVYALESLKGYIVSGVGR